MLGARAADTLNMGRLLQTISLLLCAFVIASFFLFAVTQTGHASQDQTAALTSGATVTPAPQRASAAPEREPRRFIDGVATELDSPFTGVVSSDNAWIRHLVPTALALLVYGFLLSFVARWAAGRPA
jgi:hypothetical protein